MRKVNFILPNYSSNWRVSLAGSAPPTGPTYLYSTAKSVNFGNYDDGRCFDFSIHDEGEVLNQIGAEDLVCLTTTVSNYLGAVEFAKRLKEKGASVALGGPWATVKAEQIQEQQDCFDYIVKGEGETALLGLLEGNLPRGISERGVTLASIPSLDFSGWTREDLERFQQNYTDMLKTGMYGEVPDTIPYFIFYQSSRGCVQKKRCGFCGARLGKEYSERPQDALNKDISEIVKQISPINPNIHIFNCADSFGTGLKKFSLDDLEEILGVSFTVYSRADEITPETVEKMQRIGVRKISIGFETGSQRMMDKIGKGIDVKADHFRAVKILAGSGIMTYANLIYGSPGENLDDIKSTVDHFMELAEIGDFYRVAGRIVTLLPNARWYFALMKELRKEDPSLAGQIQNNDHIDATDLQNHWLRLMTPLSLDDIAREHEKLIDFAEEKGISFSSRNSRGIQ